jgi:hypothetical protein
VLLTLPLEPTQIAPDFSTIGSNAAANPPVMGSLAFARATRFETTTRSTLSPSGFATAKITNVHQYGSSPSLEPNEVKIGHEEKWDRFHKVQLPEFALPYFEA